MRVALTKMRRVPMGLEPERGPPEIRDLPDGFPPPAVKDFLVYGGRTWLVVRVTHDWDVNLLRLQVAPNGL